MQPKGMKGREGREGRRDGHARKPRIDKTKTCEALIACLSFNNIM